MAVGKRSTGVKGYVAIPFDCTIDSWYIIADQAGSIVIDVWKDSGALPTVANTIAGTEKPTLSSATVASDVDLTSWGKDTTAGDVVGFNVDSADTVERVTLTIKYKQG